MKHITAAFFLSLVIGSCLFAGTVSTLLNGSGATFPAPLYQRWASEFHKEYPETVINYQGVGSGAGVINFIRGLTDFCASDVVLKDQEIERLHGKVVMIPVTAGMIVLAYNIPGVTKLRLSREAYVAIFLGKVTHWNDPMLLKSNPGVDLPNMPITVVTRSDGSGTTALFTGHLAAISADFDHKIGPGKSVRWPTGLAAKGNDGVVALVKGTPGSIGYVEFGFAKMCKLPMAELENKAAVFIAPIPEAGSLALSSILLSENLRDFSYDPVGSGSYPITSFSWLVLKSEYSAEKSGPMKSFLSYVLTRGQSFADALGYLALPASVIEKAEKALATIK